MIGAKADYLRARIEEEPEENEDAIADMGNDLAYLQALATTLLNERVAA